MTTERGLTILPKPRAVGYLGVRRHDYCAWLRQDSCSNSQIPISLSGLAVGTLETLPFQLDDQSRLCGGQIQFGTIPILGMRTSTHFLQRSGAQFS